jgi:hypothetical protein
VEKQLMVGKGIPEEWKSEDDYTYDKILEQKQKINMLEQQMTRSGIDVDLLYISGPSEVTTLINHKTNQRVVLFGEAH